MTRLFPAAIFAVGLVIAYWGALFGPAPLTYDEAWNWLNLSRHGSWFALTNYPVPNNHVLFTALQAALLPKAFVIWRPLFLRLPNVGIGISFLSLLYLTFRRHGFDKLTACYSCLAIPFCSLLAFSHFVIARGYLLGLFFAFAGIVRWAELLTPDKNEARNRRRAWQGALLLALSTYAVPTFGFLAMSAVICLFAIGLALRSLRLQALSIAALSFLAFVVLFYFRIARDVLRNRNLFTPPLAHDFFLRIISLLTSTSWLPLGAVIAGLALYFAFRAIHRRKCDTGAGLLLIASALLFVLILEGLIAVGAIARPFDRNAQFVPIFLWSGILLLTATSAQYRRWVFALLFLNCGFGLISSLASEWNHPLVEPIDNLYSPATAFESHRTLLIPGTITRLECQWAADPACQIYAQGMGIPVNPLHQALSLETPCVVGREKPDSPGQVYVELTSGQRGFLCF